MSKRPRGFGTGTWQTAAAKAVEIISLLDDSSTSEDDPDDAAAQIEDPTLGNNMRPAKRLRRMDVQKQKHQPQQQQQCSAALGPASAGGGITSTSVPRGARRRQPTADPRASQRHGAKALHQSALPMRPRTTTLPLQALNMTRLESRSAACLPASSDSALAGTYACAGGDVASPATSASPSLSQLSCRMSQDPECTPVSPRQSTESGLLQLPASQQNPSKQQQAARPHLRQLTFAPARTGIVGGSIDSPTTGRGLDNQVIAGMTSAGGLTAEIMASQTKAPGPCVSGPSGSAPPPPSHILSPATHAAAGLLVEMWHERHRPHREEDLVQVLHRKKVLEVKEWLERQRQLIVTRASLRASTLPLQQHSHSSVTQQQPQLCQAQHAGACQPHPPTQAWQEGSGLDSAARGSGSGLGLRLRPPSGLVVLTGPAGCGKSACLRVLAEATGFEVVEWTPPPPVMWNEHQYQRSSGPGDYGGGPPASYQSKLDDFESFISRSKYPSLALTVSAAPGAYGGSERASGATGRGGSQTTASAVCHGSVPHALAAASRPKLLLIEDLPHTHDAERRQRVVVALRDLATTARGPVVLVATGAEGQTGNGGRGGGGPDNIGPMGGAKGLHKDILAALQSAGATTISFNPVTTNNITKLLMRVAAAEGLELAPGMAVALAEAADGDVRSALQALQMNAMLQKAALRGAEAAGNVGSRRRRGSRGGKGGTGGGVTKKGSASSTALLRVGRQQALNPGELVRLVAAQRDLGLPLFHALGKLLHNKRGKDGDSHRDGDGACGGERNDEKDTDSMALQQLNSYSLAAGRQWKPQHQVQLPYRLLRPPMRYDPESILLRCGLEAPMLLSFLHENYPGFMDGEAEDAIEDVATVAAYLSDSALLCGQSRASATSATVVGGTSLWLEDSPAAANLSSAIAASMAARGLMFGNKHPAAHRFNPIRAPASSAIDQAAGANRMQLRATACRLAAAGGTGNIGGVGASGSGWNGSCSAASSTAASALFGCGSTTQLVSAVIPWLRSLVQASPLHAFWLAPLLPTSWSYYWNGAVTEGAFLRHVATLPPPYLQQQQHGTFCGGGAARPGIGACRVRGHPELCGNSGSIDDGDGATEGMLEQLVLEDEDPIEG